MALLHRSLAVLVFALAATTSGRAQTVQSTPTSSPDYLLLTKVSDSALAEAARDGYVVAAGGPLTPALLLKRGSTGPREYRLVSTSKASTFMKELNDAGSEGFRVLPGTAESSSSLSRAVLEKQPAGVRFAYSVVKETDEAARTALAEATSRGLAIVAVLGGEPVIGSPKPTFLLEQGSASGESRAREYIIASAQKTTTLEKEIQTAAADGYRAIGAGFMSVVMERGAADQAAPFDYQVLAMIRVSTGQRELNAAAAEGFRLVLSPEAARQGVFVMQRAPGTSERFDYAITEVKENTVNDLLTRASTDGYRIAAMIGNRAVLERALTR